MTGLTWNRIKHDVKVDKMNEQHKVLFNILDALYKAMENKDDRNALVKIFKTTFDNRRGSAGKI